MVMRRRGLSPHRIPRVQMSRGNSEGWVSPLPDPIPQARVNEAPRCLYGEASVHSLEIQIRNFCRSDRSFLGLSSQDGPGSKE